MPLARSLPHPYHFELQLALVRTCQELAEKGGSKLFWFLRYTGALAHWLTCPGRAARVIEEAKALN